MTSTYASDDRDHLDIQELAEADVERLRLGWWSNHESSQVVGVVRQAPGLSLWMPSTSEYILVGPWRHRPEIVNIRELVAIRYPVDLTRQAIHAAAEDGRKMFLSVEMTERRQPSFYDQAGLELLEHVISYELSPVPTANYDRLTSHLIAANALDPTTLGTLIQIDWAAFPWIWRNSEDEFRDYARQAGVELHLLRIGAHNVGYIGLTCYPGWGHVDRIAVIPEFQDQGYGRVLMSAAIARLRAKGANRIGLSTQLRNQRSQRLYASLGFRRHEAGDYRIYGRALQPGSDLYYWVTGGVQ